MSTVPRLVSEASMRSTNILREVGKAKHQEAGDALFELFKRVLVCRRVLDDVVLTLSSQLGEWGANLGIIQNEFSVIAGQTKKNSHLRLCLRCLLLGFYPGFSPVVQTCSSRFGVP